MLRPVDGPGEDRNAIVETAALINSARAAPGRRTGRGSQQVEAGAPVGEPERRLRPAMVAGDPASALRQAATIPRDAKPAVTRQRMGLDVVAAHLTQGSVDNALGVLVELRDHAPGWLRVQRYGRNLVRQALHTTRSRTIRQELRDMADFVGVVD